jgi:uncharacterized protein (TIGR02172 family)
MENVSAEVTKEGLRVSLIGHIDSSNAEAVEQAILPIRAAHPEGDFLFDGEKLDYISSAGLRMILRFAKKEKTLRVIGVSSAVYEVFEMTGFSEMIPVEKAFRRLSVEGCEVIGQGSNGKVYRLDPDTIIKVYKNPDSLPEIRHERELARAAFVKGIPTAIPYDVVRVGDGYGSVFELLSAQSFSKLLKKDPSQIDALVPPFIDLLKKIQSTDVEEGEMPNMKDVARKWCLFVQDYLSKEDGTKLLSLVEAVPDIHKMIHGDYHTKNVMMQKGETILIDMDTLAYGHPIFELAPMYLAFVGFGDLDDKDIEDFLGIPKAVAADFFHKSMEAYLGTKDEKRIQEVADKASIIGYTRLLRRTVKRIGVGTPKGQPLIEHCQERIHTLLSQYDTLVF